MENIIEREISAGVLITDGYYILGCHPYNRKNTKHNYDLPKGHVEKGESFRDTAIREVFEETGYIIENPDNLIDLGFYEYISTKDLYLFLYIVDTLPDISSLKCTTFFTQQGIKVPEVDGYKLISINELDWFFRSMELVISDVLYNLKGD